MKSRTAAVLALAVVLSVAYLAFARLTPYYMANDDVALRTIVEGTFLGVPDDQRHMLIFSNVLLGKFLVALYDWMPGVTWYDYVSLALNLLSLAAIGLCLFERVTRWHDVVAVYLLSLTWAMAFFVSPQFTLTAALAGIAAVVLAASTLVSGRRPAWRLAAALVLAAAGSLVRADAVLLVLLAGSLYALLLLNRSNLRRTMPVAVVAVAFLAFHHAVDHYDRREYAATPGYEDVKTFNTLRAQWQEFALNPLFNSPSNRAAVQRELQWTPIDATRMELLRSWVVADSSITLETLRATVEAVAPYVSKTANPWLTLNQFERSVFYKVSESLPFVLLLLLGCLLWPGRRSLAMAAWTLGVFGVLFAIVFVFYKMPPFRVSYPLLFLAAAFVILAGTRGEDAGAGQGSRGRGALAVLIVAAVCAAHLGIQREKTFQFWPYYRSVRSELQALDQRYRYVTLGGVLPVTILVYPYKPNAVLPELNFFRTGWTNVLPYVRAQLFGDSGERSVVDLACASSTRILVPDEEPGILSAVGAYAREAHGRPVEFELVGETRRYDVYECR